MLKQGLLDEATGPFATFYTKFPLTSVTGQYGCLRGISACLPGRRCDGARGITAKNIGHILAVSGSIHMRRKTLETTFQLVLGLCSHTFWAILTIAPTISSIVQPSCFRCLAAALAPVLLSKSNGTGHCKSLSHHFRGLGPAIPQEW